MTLKASLIDILRKTPLFIPVRALYTALSPKLQAIKYTEEADLKRITASVGTLLQTPLTPSGSKPKTVLIMGMGRVRFIAQEMIIRKAFEIAGYHCVVIIPQDRMVIKAYKRLGSDRLIFLDHYLAKPAHDAATILKNHVTLNDITTLCMKGVRCGKYAVSTLMRKTRSGSFDFTQSETRHELEKAFNTSIRYVETAHMLIERIAPDALVLVDRGYSPSGELFDSCIEHNIPVITWNAAHKNDTLMLKRYNASNSDAHPASLSHKTWQALLGMKWTQNHWQVLRNELEHCYHSGEWYAEVGTQFNKKLFDKENLTKRLGLDPAKKTAFIFPHIFWDATFFWGTDLFESYEEWFIQTVRAACKNDSLNWVIKVHPANLVKDKRDNVTTEHSEITAIRKAVGTLPAHVHVLAANTDISTLSLFHAMDCCVTVRGTVGIEAACFGVPVLTAGSGRFDRLGFTYDSNSREEYLSRIATAENVPPLDQQQTELARKYAYGFLMCRPALLSSIAMRYKRNETADLEVEFKAASLQALREAQDLKAIAQWIVSEEEDYIHPSSIT